MPSETNLRADLLRCFADKRLAALLEETPRQNRLRLLHDFTLWGRAAQFEPEGKDWRLWLVLGGRGAGKSRTGAEWVIRRFEGFRARAYRDAAGIWTIGFGHTSAAGAPH